MTSREHIAGEKRAFDNSWSIPALVKYRKPMRDVLLGTFFLQLMGLATPIFFQLVTDKVLVHQSMTTLEVLAIGFAKVLVFETVLSGLRNWLFARTTNRVDAQLSAELFRHLVARLFRGEAGRRQRRPRARARKHQEFPDQQRGHRGDRPILHDCLLPGHVFLFADADADRGADDPGLRRDLGVHYTALTSASRREVQARCRSGYTKRSINHQSGFSGMVQVQEDALAKNL
nr:ABC transporter transmembrane domain-containing protein [Erythrobacter sp. SAORIC-644]